MITHVMFDYAGTLATLEPRQENIIADYIWRHAGVRISKDLIVHKCSDLSSVMPYSSVVIQTARQRRQFYQEYNELLLLNLGVLHLVKAEGLFEAFRSAERHWKVRPSVGDLLTQLKRRGCKIGVISNFDKCLSEIITRDPATCDKIQYLHVSQNEGVEKPDPEFYLSFFRRHRISVGSAIYVGDSYSLDYLPAHSIGLNVVLLDENNHYPNVTQRIDKLDDMLKFI